jgi:hypothetical protein
MNTLLLTRDAFREKVFARDHGKCVVCGSPAQDAHHIMERRLFSDGGYYIDNGASVCGECHLACERTTVSVEDLRLAAGVSRSVLPDHLYPDQMYDKWGNPVLESRQRLRGELFFDPNVQKVLAEGKVLDLFTNRVKHPRTHHAPWSQGIHSDDRVIQSMDAFRGQRVIVSTKMDGEQTSLYRDFTHARSVDGGHHASRDWVKNFWSRFAADIPYDWRVCGENLYAVHSITYSALPTYFMGFGVWNAFNQCLPWDETLEWFDMLGIKAVPVLYDGEYDEAKIRACVDFSKDWAAVEGYVIRLARGFEHREFRNCVAKVVRANHVQTTQHWSRGQRIVRNGLALSTAAEICE